MKKLIIAVLVLGVVVVACDPRAMYHKSAALTEVKKHLRGDWIIRTSGRIAKRAGDYYKYFVFMEWPQEGLSTYIEVFYNPKTKEVIPCSFGFETARYWIKEVP